MADLFQVTPSLIPSEVRWDNYSAVFDAAPFLRFYVNTIAVTIARTLGQVFIASLAAFDIVYISTGGGPGGTTAVPGLEIYRMAFYGRQVGLENSQITSVPPGRSAFAAVARAGAAAEHPHRRPGAGRPPRGAAAGLLPARRPG